jgi:hypothetical protein
MKGKLYFPNATPLQTLSTGNRQVENGLKNIEFLIMVKLAQALNVELSAFFES